MPPLNVLVLAGADQHPQYSRDGQLITAALQEAGMTVRQTADAGALKSLSAGTHQIVVLYTFGDYLDEAAIDALANFVRDGGGLVGVHTAIATNPASELLGQLFGARIIKGFIGQHTIRISDPSHPVAQGLADFQMDDEWYITEKKSEFRPFLSTEFEGTSHPMGWTRRHGKGIVAYLGNGHMPGGLMQPTFKQLLSRCVHFAAGADVALMIASDL